MFGFSKKPAKNNTPEQENPKQEQSAPNQTSAGADPNNGSLQRKEEALKTRASDRLNAMDPKQLDRVQAGNLAHEGAPTQSAPNTNQARRPKQNDTPQTTQPQQHNRAPQENTTREQSAQTPKSAPANSASTQKDHSEPTPTLITPQDSSEFYQKKQAQHDTSSEPSSRTEYSQNETATNKTEENPPEASAKDTPKDVQRQADPPQRFTAPQQNKNPTQPRAQQTEAQSFQAPIRTYETDFENRSAQAGHEELEKSLEKDQARREKKKEKNRIFTPKNILATLVSILLFAGTLALIYFIVVSMQRDPQVATAPLPLISIEETEALNLNETTTSNTLVANLQEIQNTPLNEYAVRRVIPVRTTSSNEASGSVESYVKPINFLAALNAEVPPSLRENLTEEATFGIYATSQDNQPFIILKTNAYENAFSGMLAWEDTLAEKFSEWFNTGGITESTNIDAENLVIENRDVRRLFDEEDNTLLFYAFRDQSTIIITQDRTTLKTILRRLDNAQ